MHHAGKVSADQAALIAQDEFEKYRMERSKNMISDLDKAVKELEKISPTKGTENIEGKNDQE